MQRGGHCGSVSILFPADKYDTVLVPSFPAITPSQSSISVALMAIDRGRGPEAENTSRRLQGPVLATIVTTCRMFVVRL